MKVFCIERDHYSVPQVLLFVAESREAAEVMFSEVLKSENGERGDHGELDEINLSKPGRTIFEPPGDRHMTR